MGTPKWLNFLHFLFAAVRILCGVAIVSCCDDLSTYRFDISNRETFSRFMDDNTVLRVPKIGIYRGATDVTNYLKFISLENPDLRSAYTPHMQVSLVDAESCTYKARRASIIKTKTTSRLANSILMFDWDSREARIRGFSIFVNPEQAIRAVDETFSTEGFCRVLEERCGHIVDTTNCVAKYSSLPTGLEAGSLLSNSTGCKKLHLGISQWDEDHCHHASFGPSRDKNGLVKCADGIDDPLPVEGHNLTSMDEQFLEVDDPRLEDALSLLNPAEDCVDACSTVYGRDGIAIYFPPKVHERLYELGGSYKVWYNQILINNITQIRHMLEETRISYDMLESFGGRVIFRGALLTSPWTGTVNLARTWMYEQAARISDSSVKQFFTKVLHSAGATINNENIGTIRYRLLAKLILDIELTVNEATMLKRMKSAIFRGNKLARTLQEGDAAYNRLQLEYDDSLRAIISQKGTSLSKRIPKQAESEIFRLGFSGGLDVSPLGSVLLDMLTGNDPFVGEGRYMEKDIRGGFTRYHNGQRYLLNFRNKKALAEVDYDKAVIFAKGKRSGCPFEAASYGLKEMVDGSRRALGYTYKARETYAEAKGITGFYDMDGPPEITLERSSIWLFYIWNFDEDLDTISIVCLSLGIVFLSYNVYHKRKIRVHTLVPLGFLLAASHPLLMTVPIGLVMVNLVARTRKIPFWWTIHSFYSILVMIEWYRGTFSEVDGAVFFPLFTYTYTLDALATTPFPKTPLILLDFLIVIMYVAIMVYSFSSISLAAKTFSILWMFVHAASVGSMLKALRERSQVKSKEAPSPIPGKLFPHQGVTAV